MSLTLILGGTRSGKSARAESLAAGTGLAVVYVGTADLSDGSMCDRVAIHRDRRPAGWETREAGDSLARAVSPGSVTLIDGLGGWIAGRDRAAVREGVTELVDVTQFAEVIVVAEHAGEGLLPMDAVARDWLDLLGESVQQLSRVAARAELVVAGRVLELPTA
jgi:adenosyl cobinamide kinase/adenosyl cobinamide phosphate guanylyltransferase